MDPDKSGLEFRKVVSREYLFWYRIVKRIKYAFLDALECCVVEPLARDSFGLPIDGVEGIIERLGAFEYRIMTVHWQSIEWLDLRIGNVELSF